MAQCSTIVLSDLWPVTNICFSSSSAVYTVWLLSTLSLEHNKDSRKETASSEADLLKEMKLHCVTQSFEQGIYQKLN